MTEEDKPKFAFILNGLAEDKGIQLSTAGIAMKFEALKTFSIDEIQKAAISMMGNKKFSTMPSVADFIEYLGGGSVDDKAHVQAAVVWNAIKKYGGNRSVCFDDPVTQSVIVQGFGGWQKLCSEMLEDQQNWFVKDFVKMYGAFGRQGHKTYGALPGRADPFGADGPALIGNVEKAKLVLGYKPKGQAMIPEIIKSAVKSLS